MDQGTFWGIFVGTFVGIVAGAFVQYLAQRLFVRWQYKNLSSGFKRELEYDIAIFESLIHETSKLRAAIGAGSLSTYFGNFKLTDIFFVMANKLLSEGLLYDTIDNEKLLKLQKAATFCSSSSESWVASEILLHKEGKGINTPLSFVDFLENELVQHRDNLKSIAKDISK